MMMDGHQQLVDEKGHTLLMWITFFIQPPRQVMGIYAMVADLLWSRGSALCTKNLRIVQILKHVETELSKKLH